MTCSSIFTILDPIVLDSGGSILIKLFIDPISTFLTILYISEVVISSNKHMPNYISTCWRWREGMGECQQVGMCVINDARIIRKPQNLMLLLFPLCMYAMLVLTGVACPLPTSGKWRVNTPLGHETLMKSSPPPVILRFCLHLASCKEP